MAKLYSLPLRKKQLVKDRNMLDNCSSNYIFIQTFVITLGIFLC